MKETHAGLSIKPVALWDGVAMELYDGRKQIGALVTKDTGEYVFATKSGRKWQKVVDGVLPMTATLQRECVRDLRLHNLREVKDDDT